MKAFSKEQLIFFFLSNKRGGEVRRGKWQRTEDTPGKCSCQAHQLLLCKRDAGKQQCVCSHRPGVPEHGAHACLWSKLLFYAREAGQRYRETLGSGGGRSLGEKEEGKGRGEPCEEKGRWWDAWGKRVKSEGERKRRGGENGEEWLTTQISNI